jgi:hypothetical protein
LFDWRLQTAAGRVIDPTYPSTLDSAELVAGGTAAGTVIFEIGAERGDFYLLYEPDRYQFVGSTARGACEGDRRLTGGRPGSR